jgi:hypothetical protein
MRWVSKSTSKWLLVLSAAILATGGSIHGLAYPKALTVADHSALPPFFQGALKGLWLSDSLSSLALALVLVCIAVNPRLAATPLILLLALIPLAVAVVLFYTMGNFFAGYLMLAAAGAASLSAVIRPPTTFTQGC